MNHKEEKSYWAKDIADLLDVKTSTLRRWSIELEKAGYRFYRDEHNRRAYVEKDVIPLSKLKEFLSNKMSMEDATNAVSSMFVTDDIGRVTTPVHEEKDDDLRLSKSDLKEIIRSEVQKAVMEERESMFQAFEQKMNDVVEHRDRVIMTQLQQSMEKEQPRIAATSEESEKKPIWKKIFRK